MLRHSCLRALVCGIIFKHAPKWLERTWEITQAYVPRTIEVVAKG